MTFAQIAIEQCTEAREIRYGNRVKVLWHNGAARECKVLMRDMSAVLDAMVARFDSELHDDDLVLQLACFDLGEWSDIKGLVLDGAAEAQHRSLLLTNRYDKISRARRLDVLESRRQFKAVVRCCVRERRRTLGIQPSDTVDNRSVWCHIFTPDCDEQDFGVVRLAASTSQCPTALCPSKEDWAKCSVCCRSTVARLLKVVAPRGIWSR